MWLVSLIVHVNHVILLVAGTSCVPVGKTTIQLLSNDLSLLKHMFTNMKLYGWLAEWQLQGNSSQALNF